ncbi:MAG: hypothetical protein SPK76_08130 [Bacteroidales bacterium]|nr:hypothetical protein [Bacteroidales bacterium]MDY6444974.1 hypothetical protein [Bacteroidales bacterium]
MKTIRFTAALLCAFALASCDEMRPFNPNPDQGLFSLSDVAKILSDLPLESEHLDEVYDAVSASSGHGYDEEYRLTDLFEAPGAGVGDSPQTRATKAGGYTMPLRELFANYLTDKYGTKAGAADVERYINALSDSDMQIYWPYSEEWNGKDFPIVTFDPGYGAEANYGYEVRIDSHGAHVVDSVIVTEQVARERPVWVINRNDDAAFTPFELFEENTGTKASKDKDKGQGDSKEYILSIRDFKMLRNYDSWFGGASEFFIKTGAVDGFKATKDEDLKNYSPSLTDLMVVIKRSQLNRKVPFNALLLTNFTEQMEKIAFMVIEDDGGTTTNWKCSAVVKCNSKQYGFELNIPYKDKDDIVWRGQLTRNYFDDVFAKGGGTLTGRFGDVEITFALE